MTSNPDIAGWMKERGMTLIGPLTYGGKKDCDSAMCRRSPWTNPDCAGWHCVYCDAPTSYQGHNCDVAEALLGEAQRIVEERTQ